MTTPRKFPEDFMIQRGPHWAFELIGKPWAPDARGPDAFDCVGLVAWCMRARLGVDMPSLAEVADGVKWHRVDGPWRENDVVLMQGAEGRHIGYVVDAGRLGVLHAEGHLTARGPVGSVVFQTFEQATSGGYHRFELWRFEP